MILDPEILRFVCEYGVMCVCSCTHVCVLTCAFSWMPRKMPGLFPTTLISVAGSATELGPHHFGYTIFPISSKDLVFCSTILVSTGVTDTFHCP